jgi:L-alanine-DL-glutamate epimerase-like enolase superfamily enzyme
MPPHPALSRRQLLQWAALTTGSAWMSQFQALAAPFTGDVKITAIKALQLDFQFDGCLIKIETDAGLVGYGETGTNAAMARTHLAHLTSGEFPGATKYANGPAGLIGSDPLAIEKHFYRLTSLQHPYMALTGTLSGIDIALWDLAGKITGQPVYKLLGGPFRDGCRMYSHGDALTNMHDKSACRAWVAEMKAQPEGFNFFKFNIDQAFPIERPFHPTVTSAEMRLLYRAYSNVREAAGDAFDIGVACHGEFDTPSAIAISKTVEPLKVAFVEDSLNVTHHDGWNALRRATSVPLLTGEKLELLRQFKPFLDTQAADIIHPDISFAGGITACRKIADYAAHTRTPVALHNVGTLVRTYASAHLSMAIQNFYRSESWLGRPGRLREQMTKGQTPAVKGGILQVPNKPGLGLDLDDNFLKQHMAKGEIWWG